jgi:hypothetical protein
LARALLLVTKGSLFWIVAVGPEKTAIRGFLPVVLRSGTQISAARERWKMKGYEHSFEMA